MHVTHLAMFAEPILCAWYEQENLGSDVRLPNSSALCRLKGLASRNNRNEI